MANQIDYRMSKLQILRRLEIGQRAIFSVEERSTIRTYCSEFGLAWKRKFRTETDRTTRSVVVTRIK